MAETTKDRPILSLKKTRTSVVKKPSSWNTKQDINEEKKPSIEVKSTAGTEKPTVKEAGKKDVITHNQRNKIGKRMIPVLQKKHKVMAKWLPLEVGVKAHFKDADEVLGLAAYCRCSRYLKAVAQPDSKRHKLDGTVVCDVDDTQRKWSISELEKRKKNQVKRLKSSGNTHAGEFHREI